jgi:hypothetical protein
MLPESIIIAVLLSAVAFAQSSGQSLADAARANQAKQQAQEASGTRPRVISNQDLPAPTPGIPQSNASDPMTTVSGVNRTNHDPEQRPSNRFPIDQRAGQQWRERIHDQENRIADLQARIDRVNSSTRASVGTAQYETPVNRYQAVQSERLGMMREMLDQQKRRLEMMQDASRHAGMNQ